MIIQAAGVPSQLLDEQAREIVRRQRTEGGSDNPHRRPPDHDYWCAGDPSGQGYVASYELTDTQVVTGVQGLVFPFNQGTYPHQ